MHPTYSGPIFSFTTLTLLKSEKEPMRFSDVLYMISEAMMNFVQFVGQNAVEILPFRFQISMDYLLSIEYL